MKLVFLGNFSLFDLVIIVICVLNIILFFKIWGMTNNVSLIVELLKQQMKSKESIVNRSDKDINIGDLIVVLSNEKQLRVKDIKDGKYICGDSRNESADVYKREEIELFDKYWKK